jgi:hypothetical protein
MERIDIMTDIETLGRDSCATIFQVAAIAFNIETGEYINKFNMIADIEKNKSLNVSGETLKWWLNTDKDLLAKLLNSGEYSSEEIITKFYEWIISLGIDMKNVYLWGNGILFDNKILQHQMQSIGLEYPIFYRNDRDMRTLVELASYKVGINTEKEFRDKYKNLDLKEHDAFDDVRGQIDIVVKCYNMLIK